MIFNLIAFKHRQVFKQLQWGYFGVFSWYTSNMWLTSTSNSHCSYFVRYAIWRNTTNRIDQFDITRLIVTSLHAASNAVAEFNARLFPGSKGSLPAYAHQCSVIKTVFDSEWSYIFHHIAMCGFYLVQTRY